MTQDILDLMEERNKFKAIANVVAEVSRTKTQSKSFMPKSKRRIHK